MALPVLEPRAHGSHGGRRSRGSHTPALIPPPPTPPLSSEPHAVSARRPQRPFWFDPAARRRQRSRSPPL